MAWALSLVFSVLYALSQVLYLVLPLYAFSGGAEGYAGILGYRLSVLERGAASPVLQTLWAPALSVAVSMPAAVFSVAVAFPRRRRASLPGALGVAELARHIRGVRPWTSLAGPCLAIAASGLSMGLRTPVLLVASRLAGSFSHATSAGRVLLPEVLVSPTPALALPLLALLFSTLSAALLAVSIAARHPAEEVVLVRRLPASRGFGEET